MPSHLRRQFARIALPALAIGATWFLFQGSQAEAQDATSTEDTASTAIVPEAAETVAPILIGSKMPDATLLNQEGKEVDLQKMVADKATVFVFFRGNW